jgi:hypothetical protein
MKHLGFAGVIFLVWLLVVVFGGYGWVMNIVEIVNADFNHIDGVLVVRIVGIFLAPLGAVLGYL